MMGSNLEFDGLDRRCSGEYGGGISEARYEHRAQILDMSIMLAGMVVRTYIKRRPKLQDVQPFRAVY
jgi:hypothetical protein